MIPTKNRHRVFGVGGRALNYPIPLHLPPLGVPFVVLGVGVARSLRTVCCCQAPGNTLLQIPLFLGYSLFLVEGRHHTNQKQAGYLAVLTPPPFACSFLFLFFRRAPPAAKTPAPWQRKHGFAARRRKRKSPEPKRRTHVSLKGREREGRYGSKLNHQESDRSVQSLFPFLFSFHSGYLFFTHTQVALWKGGLVAKYQEQKKAVIAQTCTQRTSKGKNW